MYQFDKTVKQVESLLYFIHVFIYSAVLLTALSRIFLLNKAWGVAIAYPSAAATYLLFEKEKN